MRFQLTPLGPGVGFVMVIDIADQQAAGCFVDDQPHIAINSHRPEVFVARFVQLVKAQTVAGRIELQVERRRLSSLLLVAGERRGRGTGIDRLPEPLTLGVVVQVLELVAQGAAVEITRALNDVGRGASAIVAERRRRNQREIGLGQPVELRLELSRAGRSRPERVDLDGEVAVALNGADFANLPFPEGESLHFKPAAKTVAQATA